MGIHNSKESQLLKASLSGDDIRQAAPPTPTKPTIVRKHTNYNGWHEIYRCAHAEWLHGIGESFGFARHAFTCHSELHSVCAPGFCSESLSSKLHQGFTRRSQKNFPSTSLSTSTRSKKLREHFEYNHIPAMISSLQNYSVYGIVNGCSMSRFSHGETIMLSVYSVVLDKTQFIIVDLKLNRYVCTLGNDYNGVIDPSRVHAAWSMDRTQVVIRVPSSNGSSVLDFYTIVKKEAKIYRRILPVDGQAQFQFTPKYWSSRLIMYTDGTPAQSTIINYHVTTLTPGGSNKVQLRAIPVNQQSAGSCLSLKNVHNWSTYTDEHMSINEGFRLLSILYTPDSAHVVLAFADARCHCGEWPPLSYFDIHHGTTLQRLIRLRAQLIAHVCPLHTCRNFLTPIFSRASSRMAFCTTNSNARRELQVSVIALPNEMNLKSICRRAIIEHLSERHGNIENVARALPYRLGQYVQYRPECQ